jgi:transaldolase
MPAMPDVSGSPAKKARCVDALEQLRAMTTVVADTGDVAAIRRLQPQDATTNPALVLQAFSGADGETLLDRALEAARSDRSLQGEALVSDVCDRLAVLVGCDILSAIHGLVSTEVDADLSFNTHATITKARRLMQLYKEAGVDTSRVLIKLGSTWESIEACRQLEKEGIHCNMTLIFSFAQAVACAEADATLISPFVGRILDWYRKNSGREYTADEDPGVISVRRIYNYYKQNGHKTVVMGASFRSTGEILALAGCDKLTIGPKFLDELKQQHATLSRQLDPEVARSNDKIERLADKAIDEMQFRWHHNEDAMATEKLAEGIRGFAKDLVKLKDLVRGRIVAKLGA